jgi:hypothetical protein
MRVGQGRRAKPAAVRATQSKCLILAHRRPYNQSRHLANP